MAKKKVQSVFRDLYPEDQAAEMEMRSLLLQGLGNWLAGADMTQTEAAKVLGITQARVSDIKRGKISSFSLDLLVRLAAARGSIRSCASSRNSDAVPAATIEVG